MMAPAYKLTYFDVRAVAEPIRFLLSYGGLEFDDVRVNMEEWKTIKDTSPFGKLPMLSVDGKTIHQSLAICRYLAKQVKLLADTEWEALEADIAVDTITDFKTHIGEYIKFSFYGGDEEEKAKKLATIKEETLPYYLPKFEAIVAENEGYFVKGKLTWADIFWACHADSVKEMLGFDILAEYPQLRAVQAKVYALPAIKAWIAKRPNPELLI